MNNKVVGLKSSIQHFWLLQINSKFVLTICIGLFEFHFSHFCRGVKLTRVGYDARSRKHRRMRKAFLVVDDTKWWNVISKIKHSYVNMVRLTPVDYVCLLLSKRVEAAHCIKWQPEPSSAYMPFYISLKPFLQQSPAPFPVSQLHISGFCGSIFLFFFSVFLFVRSRIRTRTCT